MCRPPRVKVEPPAATTDGDLADLLAGEYGLRPDPAQRLVLDAWLAKTRDGLYAARVCGLAQPRQNGKNAVLEMRELYGMVGFGERILHTAHQVKTARRHFKRLKGYFGEQASDPSARFPELNRLVAEVRNQNGVEGIFLSNGGSLEMAARSKSSGRGYTVDVLVLDEAQELSDDALEALVPVTSAAPLGSPQVLWTGTPPGPNAEGEVFSRLRHSALTGSQDGLAWHEWSLPDRPLGEFDLDDRRLWAETNPALAAGRLLLSVVESERANLSDAGFARERLGWWGDTRGRPSAVVSFDRWARCEGPAPTGGTVAYGVRFASDGSGVALAGAVKPADGPVFVEVIEAKPASWGTRWLVEWLVERHRGASRIVVDGRSGAGDLVNSLRAERVPARRILTPTLADIETAHSGWLRDVLEGGLGHSGQRGLDDAVRGAVKRKIGTRGGWGVAPANSGVDVTPLEAVILARHGAVVAGRKTSSGRVEFA